MADYCRCQTEERAAIMWADELLSDAEASKMARSGVVCRECEELFNVQTVRGSPGKAG